MGSGCQCCSRRGLGGGVVPGFLFCKRDILSKEKLSGRDFITGISTVAGLNSVDLNPSCFFLPFTSASQFCDHC